MFISSIIYVLLYYNNIISHNQFVTFWLESLIALSYNLISLNLILLFICQFRSGGAAVGSIQGVFTTLLYMFRDNFWSVQHHLQHTRVRGAPAGRGNHTGTTSIKTIFIPINYPSYQNKVLKSFLCCRCEGGMSQYRVQQLSQVVCTTIRTLLDNFCCFTRKF